METIKKKPVGRPETPAGQKKIRCGVMVKTVNYDKAKKHFLKVVKENNY